jgi:hypothetical protein
LAELTSQYNTDNLQNKINEKIKKAHQKEEDKIRRQEVQSFIGSPRSEKSHISVDGQHVAKPRKLTMEDQFKNRE